MNAPRVSNPLRLSEEAHRGWMRVAGKSGTNLNALAEAIGRLLDERRIVLSEDVLELARQVQAERRRRR